MERRAAICGGMVEVESSGERVELVLRGEDTRGRDHWTGLKTMGSNVGLRFAGRLLKLSGLTGNGGRGIVHRAVAVAVTVSVDLAPWAFALGIGTLKRGAMVRESFLARGRSGADADSDTGREAGCSEADLDSDSDSDACGGVGVGVSVGMGVGSDDSAGDDLSTGN